MTSYSVLSTTSKFTVIATWTSGWEDLSTAITSFTDPGQAARAAVFLTRLSEDAWDTAAFLDTTAPVEAAIGELIDGLRGTDAELPSPVLDLTECRHADEWSTTDLSELLTDSLAEFVATLSRAQRLSIADEIATDAGQRAEALRLLPTGFDPDDQDCRIWQMCEVTRSLHNGHDGLGLPTSGAAWLIRGWSIEHSPARRWGARQQLARMDQLLAACIVHGGRGLTHDDPLSAHLVFPGAREHLDNEVIDVRIHQGDKGSWPDPFEPMTIRITRGTSGQPAVIEHLAADDDQGFARVMGDWTKLVPYRA